VNETVQLAENFYQEYLLQDAGNKWEVELRTPVRLVHSV
jgi:hypothetical protein